MELSKVYAPQQIEEKWYQFWLDNKLFASQPHPEKEPYTVVMPPPNVTGVLHMGHMLNNTIQDVLVRKARMSGFETCWVPGTDHASIATEAKVVAMLKEKGINKKEIGREAFLKYAWEWKEKYGGIILKQLEKLGCSCDWDRTRFTMEDELSNAVIKTFVDLYNKKLIYKGVRMVNWDPAGKTALSDEEVNHKQVRSKLYYIKYKIVGENNFLTIATTRPETIYGDTAICCHPEDERYISLKGKKVLIPLINKEIPIIFDEYIDREFGTGCLKVTPAHDINDYHLGLKYNLPVIDILDDEGKLNAQAEMFVGIDRFVARKKTAQKIEEEGLLEKIEEITNNVGHSERTDAVIEPKISTQWFLSMDQITAPALENVMNGNINFYPDKFKNTYKHWLENVKDWCISRQLWWGQRIPAYYLPDGSFVVAENHEKALQLALEKNKNLTINDLKQDEDVLDTWFSSWLWPISVFDGITKPDNKEISYYYPTNDLVTAPEILFFWVARMIMAGYEFKHELPFKNVYLTGIVRDKQGRKMSKSLGNSPDPIDLIAQYSADGVRAGMLFCSPAGNDILFDEKLCEQGRNFCNKIWNAFRLLKGWQIIDKPSSSNDLYAIDWFENRLHKTLEQLEENYVNYRLSDALMMVYKLIWDDYCAWYLEMVKPEFHADQSQSPISSETYNKTIDFLETLLKIVHPFMPFISEEIFSLLKEREEKELLIIAEYPLAKKYQENDIKIGEQLQNIVAQVRNFRSKENISPKQKLEVYIKTQDVNGIEKAQGQIEKLANLSSFSFTNSKIENAVLLISGKDELFIPIEVENPAKKIEEIEKEIVYQKGFLDSVEKKLSNTSFVEKAPKNVLENENQKKNDAIQKIKSLEESLSIYKSTK